MWHLARRWSACQRARSRHDGAALSWQPSGTRGQEAARARLMPDGWITDLALVAALILIGGFFAASEIALITVKRHRLHQLVSEGSSNAAVAERLTSDPSRFLATIQIAITFLGFLASAVGAVSLSGSLAELIGLIPFIDGGTAGQISFVVVTLLIALASIIIGELVPK